MENNSGIKHLVDLYCEVKRENETIVDITQMILVCIILILNIIFWTYRIKHEKKQRKRVVTLDA
jgi:hypothetical protein